MDETIGDGQDEAGWDYLTAAKTATQQWLDRLVVAERSPTESVSLGVSTGTTVPGDDPRST